jgi:hypothetical protein
LDARQGELSKFAKEMTAQDFRYCAGVSAES